MSLSLLIDSEVTGHPCTGQCLDAQEWSDGTNLVVIGTEDGEGLSYRFPKLGLGSGPINDDRAERPLARFADIGQNGDNVG